MALKTAIVPALKLEITETLALIEDGTAVDVTLDVPGAQPGWFYLVTSDELDAGLIIGQAFSDTAGEVEVRIANVTAGDITPGAVVFNVIAF
jgi:hypothetical protein